VFVALAQQTLQVHEPVAGRHGYAQPELAARLLRRAGGRAAFRELLRFWAAGSHELWLRGWLAAVFKKLSAEQRDLLGDEVLGWLKEVPADVWQVRERSGARRLAAGAARPLARRAAPGPAHPG